MSEADQLDDALTRHGYPPSDDLDPASEQLTRHFHREGRTRLAEVARRGWVVAMPNHGFGALEQGYGRYAELASQVFDRLDVRIDEVADYAASRNGSPGLLLGVDTGESATYYWKPTGFRRDQCHPSLVECAVNDTLERADLEQTLIPLVADTIVAFAIVPDEVAELLRETFDNEDVQREDAPKPPRALNEREFDDLPKRNS